MPVIFFAIRIFASGLILLFYYEIQHVYTFSLTNGILSITFAQAKYHSNERLEKSMTDKLKEYETVRCCGIDLKLILCRKIK
jgi:multisubunit Na+/H+ antiporter MnhG subunit